jgi:hypothetical protein
MMNSEELERKIQESCQEELASPPHECVLCGGPHRPIWSRLDEAERASAPYPGGES